METTAEAPTPTSEPKAAAKLMKGKVTAKPAIPKEPTPWPIKMLSIIFYRDAAVMATIAGMAYRISNLRMFSDPKVKGDSCIDINENRYF